MAVSKVMQSSNKLMLLKGRHPDYIAMEKNWEKSDDIWAGNDAIEAKMNKYLPRGDAEEPDSYKSRKSRAVLYNLYRKSIKALTAMLLRRPMVLGDDVPAEIKGYTENIDLQGNHLDRFAVGVVEAAIKDGHTFLYVHSTVDSEMSNYQRKILGMRPYLMHVSARSVIDWDFDETAGVPILSYVKFAESKYERQERGAKPVKVTHYREVWIDESGDVRWEEFDQLGNMVDSGITDLPFIPLIPIYANRTGQFASEPLLLDMLHLQVRHFQLTADMYHQMHVSAVPILVIKGRNSTSKPIVVTPNAGVDVPEGGDVKWCELVGSTIEAHQREALNLEQRMFSIGVSTFLKSTTERKTAQEAATEAFAQNSDLVSLGYSLRDGLEQAFEYMAILIGKDDGGSINLRVDFEMLTNPNLADSMLKFYEARILPVQELQKFAVRKGLTSEEFVPDSGQTYFIPEQERG